MLGIGEKKVREIISEELERFRQNVLEERMKGVLFHTNPQDLARQALQEILAKIDPKEFLNNLLLTKGLTIEGLVHNAVEEYIRREDLLPSKEEAVAKIVEELSDRLESEVDQEDIADAIAKQISENPNSFLATEEFKKDVAEKVAESCYDDINMDDLYPFIGEKIVEHLKEPH